MEYNLIFGVLAVLLVLYLIYCYMEKPATPTTTGFATNNLHYNKYNSTPKRRISNYVSLNSPPVSSVKYSTGLYNIPPINDQSYLAGLRRALPIMQNFKTNLREKKQSGFKSNVNTGLWLAQRGIGNIASTFEGGDEPVSNANVDMKPVDFTRNRTNPDLQPINRYYLQY